MSFPYPAFDSHLATSSRVLVVDDQLANRELLRAILEGDGHEVVVCESGAAALGNPETDACDIALLDLRMPGMDGFELLDELRKRPKCSDLPVVFLTAYDDRELHDRALASGVDDFLVKPVRKTEVLIRVRSLVALRRTRSALVETGRELARRNEALERAQEARRMLASFVVHDLKNPIQAIALGAHFLARTPHLGEDAIDIVRTIDDGATRMKRLVVDLLDIERGEDGVLVAPTETLPLDTILASLREIARSNSSTSRVEVMVLATTNAVLANEGLLHRVVTNVVDNAVRYSPTGETVKMKVDCIHDYLRIRVIDRGVGIDPSQRAHVFERYAQLATKRTSTDRGHGLGLAFCKMAIRAMNGTIEVHDGEDGVGTTFEIRIPLADASQICA